MQITDNSSFDWNKFLHIRLSTSEYAFTVNELIEKFDLAETVIYQALNRLIRKRAIVKIRQGFYVVLPLDNTQTGVVSVYLYIDDLMKSLGKPYYLGLLGAASLHGAAHQAPMADYVVTTCPLPRNIVNKKMKLYFIGKKELVAEGIMQKKGRTGYFNVSSPEQTAFDLLDQIRRFGLDHISTVLQELHEAMRAPTLKKIAVLNNNTANIQRLGYILENFTENQKLADTLYKVLENRKYSPVGLSPLKGRKGKIDKKWQIIINTQIDPDL
jgi:predicted transcriptional regulator of viral defense system